MRKPLLATKSVTLVHYIRRGTGSTSYTTVLSGVSCREVAAAGTGAQSGAGSGFAPKSSSEICIFPGHSTAAPQSTAELPLDAASTFLDPAAFKAADEAARACHWTLAPEDKVTLPSGHVGTVTSVQDNRDGRCPHWYVEVTG